MAIAFDNARSHFGSATENIATVIITAASDAILFASIFKSGQGAQSAVYCQGTPMTLLESNIMAGLTASAYCAVYILTAPAAGALTLSAVNTGTNGSYKGLIATTYTGVKASGPTGTRVRGSSTTNVNLSVSSTATDVVFSMWAAWSQTAMTVNAGNIRGSASYSSRPTIMVVADIAGNSAVSLSAVVSNSKKMFGVAIPLIASASAGGGDPGTPLFTLGMMGCGC